MREYKDERYNEVTDRSLTAWVERASAAKHIRGPARPARQPPPEKCAANVRAYAPNPPRFTPPESASDDAAVDERPGEESPPKPEPDRGSEFARRDLRRQVRHRYLDDKIDGDLNDQRDYAPDQAIHDIGGMSDGADHREDETEQDCRIIRPPESSCGSVARSVRRRTRTAGSIPQGKSRAACGGPGLGGVSLTARGYRAQRG